MEPSVSPDERPDMPSSIPSAPLSRDGAASTVWALPCPTRAGGWCPGGFGARGGREGSGGAACVAQPASPWKRDPEPVLLLFP